MTSKTTKRPTWREQVALGAITCPECGKGKVRLLGGSGRTVPYHPWPLAVPDSLLLPTCDACGTWLVDEQAAKDLDDTARAAGLIRQPLGVVLAQDK